MRTKFILFGIPIFIFFALILGWHFFISAPKYVGQDTIFEVQEGMSLRQISGGIYAAGLIRSRVAFEACVILYGGEKHLSIGDYLFENKMPVFEIARRISVGEKHLAPLKITFPEGFDNADISAVLEGKLRNFNENEFAVHAAGKQGYLFPDTYFFLTTDDAAQAVSVMENNFKKKVAPLAEEILASGRTEKDIIIMASLVEREAKGDADRALISGILWNRIKKGMRLEADAAPETYKKSGLPEEPIANPGLEAIRAAIHPEASAYLFYLHDKQGVIHYGKNFAEHRRNIQNYLK